MSNTAGLNATPAGQPPPRHGGAAAAGWLPTSPFLSVSTPVCSPSLSPLLSTSSPLPPPLQRVEWGRRERPPGRWG